MNRSDYCCCCGALRGLSARNQAYSLHDIVPVEPHRPMQRGDGRLFELSPQLIVHVGVYRNGGGSADEHICNDCLMVGIRHALETLQKLVPTAPASQPVTPAEDEPEPDPAEEWRRLALQFDGHRMQAIGLLKLIDHTLKGGAAFALEKIPGDIATFLAAPPLSGEKVLAERIAALAAQPEDQQPGAAAEAWREDRALDFPDLTPELANILGTMCFQCISFAQALRAAGHQIKTQAEDEQAAVLHWMLGHYFRHGDDGWRKAAAEDMKRMQAAALAAKGGAL